MPVDLVLSSGFLAFGRQTGFLRAVEQADLSVAAVCGTSSGALAGALWAAGMPAEQVLARLSAQSPLSWAQPHLAMWRGVFSLDDVVAQLRADLPARIEDLPLPFAVGVVGPEGHRLISTGPLPEAVAASCAVPWLFAPVAVDEVPCSDGGAADRAGLAAWRELRPQTEVLLHLVDRSGTGSDPALDRRTTLIRSERSGARLWGLGDVRARHQQTFESAAAFLRDVPEAWR